MHHRRRRERLRARRHETPTETVADEMNARNRVQRLERGSLGNAIAPTTPPRFFITYHVVRLRNEFTGPRMPPTNDPNDCALPSASPPTPTPTPANPAARRHRYRSLASSAE